MRSYVLVKVRKWFCVRRSSVTCWPVKGSGPGKRAGLVFETTAPRVRGLFAMLGNLGGGFGCSGSKYDGVQRGRMRFTRSFDSSSGQVDRTAWKKIEVGGIGM